MFGGDVVATSSNSGANAAAPRGQRPGRGPAWVFVAGKCPTLCKHSREWAVLWGCCGSMSMGCSCASFPWASLHPLGCSWVWRCPPLQHRIFLQGNSYRSWWLCHEKGASGRVHRCLPCVPSVPLPKGDSGFAAGGPRQHVKHSALTKPRYPQRTPFCHGLAWWQVLWAPLSVRLSGSMSHGSVRLSKALFYLLSAAAP